MRWASSEYAMKGLFLGLLLYTALQASLPSATQPAESSPGQKTGTIALYMLAGIGAALGLALLRQIRDLLRFIRRPFAFFVFLLLENPLLIYLGVIGGLACGAFAEFTPPEDSNDLKPNLIVLSLGGAILGYGFGLIRDVRDSRYRLALGLGVGAAVIVLINTYLQEFDGGLFLIEGSLQRRMLAYQILLGLPFYYLLCFAGVTEESEAEIAGLCTMLGLAIYLLKFPNNMPAIGLILPGGFYLGYVVYVLPGLRVFKHTLRGFIYMQVGKLRPALLSFRRALELDPRNSLAHQGMDHLHTTIDIESVDAATLALLDPLRCSNRLRLLLSRRPTPDEMTKVHHLLNLLERIWPRLIAQALYFRAVAAVHAGEIDRACEMLNDLVNPEGWFPNDDARNSILFDAWQLVLLVHPVLKMHVGEPQLEQPGRRIEAIAAVERQLAVQPNEPGILELRKVLYENLTEREYFDAATEAPPVDFGHAYAEELGMALIASPEQWRRGAQFLRMAANGLPLRRPVIFNQLSEAYAKAGEPQQATRYLQLLRDSGLEIALPNLPAEHRKIYYTAVRRLADDAASRGETDEAIFNYSLATNDPDSGVPTLRALAEQFENKKDVFNALRVTEKGLLYDGREADLLKKKDRYYYSLTAMELAARAKEDDNVRKYFDVAYCIKKAKSVLDDKGADLDLLDWADHLVSLALVMQPKNLSALALQARLKLRRGDRQEGLRILEDVREMKPSGTEESEAWYYVQKQLGKLYLDELDRADLAIPCFLEYKNHMGSGADTLYDLGRAYEAGGDRANAIKYYNQVTAYEQHPLRWDAEAAVRRLKGQ
jgi:tetratricopeptide (TPR) repeat protein